MKQRTFRRIVLFGFGLHLATQPMVIVSFAMRGWWTLVAAAVCGYVTALVAALMFAALPRRGGPPPNP